jgi:peptide/nickel transport system ATP-binding protein
VDGVSFDLAAGESLAVIGESGCGKTLMARALLGLAPDAARTTGSIRLRDRELAGSTDEEWRRVRGREISLVFQEPASAFDPVVPIGAQIVEAVRMHNPVSLEEARTIALERLREVGFPDPPRGLTEYAHRLSGGLRQRAFLAMALASDPAILVADEPTTALDATVSAQVLELFDRLRETRGLALVLITHDLGSVAAHTDRAIVLYAGRVVEEASTGELFRAPRHPYTRGLLASVPRVPATGAGDRRFSAIPGAVPDLGDRPRGVCAFAPRCPDRFEPCLEREPALYRTGESSARCFLYGA